MGWIKSLKIEVPVLHGWGFKSWQIGVITLSSLYFLRLVFKQFLGQQLLLGQQVLNTIIVETGYRRCFEHNASHYGGSLLILIFFSRVYFGWAEVVRLVNHVYVANIGHFLFKWQLPQRTNGLIRTCLICAKTAFPDLFEVWTLIDDFKIFKFDTCLFLDLTVEIWNVLERLTVRAQVLVAGCHKYFEYLNLGIAVRLMQLIQLGWALYLRITVYYCIFEMPFSCFGCWEYLDFENRFLLFEFFLQHLSVFVISRLHQLNSQ